MVRSKKTDPNKYGQAENDTSEYCTVRQKKVKQKAFV
jgi:hypothetical protein